VQSDLQVISVADIPVALYLGVPERERRTKQEVLISVAVYLEEPAPFDMSSRIGDTIDYSEVIRFVQEQLPAAGAFVLIETVAEKVATFALARAMGASSVEVVVKKPSVLMAPAMASVTLRRRARR
jgi:FolB domain-containing protein